MKLKHLLVIFVSLSLFSVACKRDKTDPKAEHEEIDTGQNELMDPRQPGGLAKTPPRAQPEAALKASGPSNTNTVTSPEVALLTVPRDGQTFDPSVPAAQIPAGAWYCDMHGEVHYAAMDKKDGKCPVCHMFLTQQPD